MKLKATIITIVIIIALIVTISSKSSTQNFGRLYSVKLYSGTKMVASWTARDLGKIDGPTLTFSIGNDLDVNARQVRISGTYSVEEIQ